MNKRRFLHIYNKVAYHFFRLIALLAIFYCYLTMPESFKIKTQHVSVYLRLFFKKANRAFFGRKPKLTFFGISDPLSIPWPGTSDFELASSFKLKDFGFSLLRIDHYKYCAFILFCGYLKRIGLFEEVLHFSTSINATTDPTFKALALREKADIQCLFFRWHEEQAAAINAGTYFRLSDYFPEMTNLNNHYETTLTQIHLDDVVKLYKQAIDTDATIPWLHFELGNLYRYKNNYVSALVHYNKAKQAGAGMIADMYAAQAAYFLDKDERRYAQRIAKYTTIEAARKNPRTVGFKTLYDLRERYPSITVVWPSQSINPSYRAAYQGKLTTVTKNITFPPKCSGHFSHLRKISHPFSVVDDTFMLTDTIHYGSHGYKMFNTHLLEYDDKEACIFFRNNDAQIEEKKITSPVILLGGRITKPDYFHSIYDTLGSLALLESQNFLENRDIVLGEKPVKWLHDIIQELNLPNNIKVIEHTNDNSSAIIFEDVVQLSCPSYMTIPHPKAINFLRRRLCAKPHNITKGRFVHFSRSKSRTIKTESRENFYQFLENEGFEIIDPGTLSISEQKALLKDVEIISVEGGAALSNLIYCPKGAKVIVIAPSTLIFEVFTVIAHVLEQQLWYCIEDPTESYPNPFFLWNSANLDVDLATYDACLREAKAT